MRIGIIGHFGGNENFTDGQTVKTVTLYRAFVNRNINNGAIHCVDTYYIRKNPIRFIYQMMSMLFFDKKVIVLLSKNGRRVLFPIMYFMCKYLKKEIYHYGIGGRLAREVSQNAKFKKYVSNFTANWMESVKLRDALLEQGISNAIFLPNFKSIKSVETSDLTTEYTMPYSFCTFSRVMESKGITDAIKTITEINQKAEKTIAKLDIYGPIEDEYHEELVKSLSASKGACNYCGVIDTNKSVETLRNYYMLLFPTHWRHEGIPGTIIDSFASGVPVISRRWQYCDEMITNGINGLVYEWDEPNKLFNQVLYAINNPQRIIAMKENCVHAASKYLEDAVIEKICSEMKIR